jgi:c-di-GMP-binding flagellar brake protein YcgR
MDERRKYPRIEISFPIECETCPDKYYFYTVTKDLSLGGAKILTENFLPKDYLMKIKINFIDKMMQVQAKVAWCNQMRVCDRYCVGLEFLNLNSQQQKDISYFLSQINPAIRTA